MNLKEELHSCQQFLVYFELERVRHKAINYATENVNATKVDEKLNPSFNNLKCVAKVNRASGFNLKNRQDGVFRSFYAHQNRTLLDRSKHAGNKDDLTKVEHILNKTDVFESCSGNKTEHKVEVIQVDKLNVPIGWKDAVVPKPLLKNHAIVPRIKGIKDYHIATTCVVFVPFLLSIYKKINDWKKKHPKVSTYSSIEWMASVPIKSR